MGVHVGSKGKVERLKMVPCFITLPSWVWDHHGDRFSSGSQKSEFKGMGSTLS